MRYAEVRQTSAALEDRGIPQGCAFALLIDRDVDFELGDVVLARRNGETVVGWLSVLLGFTIDGITLSSARGPVTYSAHTVELRGRGFRSVVEREAARPTYTSTAALVADSCHALDYWPDHFGGAA